MGSRYSINGFINAALRRTGKTLLVEGVSDRSVILRLCVDQDSPSNFTVDQAGILDGECCAGLGNKDKVKEVVRVAQQLAEHLPKINEVLAVLHDREWDGLAPGEGRLADEWIAPSQGARQFSTQGHSIENYNFRRDHVISYLKMGFSDSLKNGFFTLVGDEFSKILSVSACISLALQEASLLSRVGGLLRHEHFQPGPDRIFISDAFKVALQSRGCESLVADSVVTRANELVSTYAECLTNRAGVQWLPHGHAGEECIWSCVGAYARISGVSDSVCNNIVGFGKSERQRYMATLISQSRPDDIVPLPSVVEWLAA